MSLAALQNALHAWFTAATGLPTIWANQGGPRPPFPYATLKLLVDANVGGDHRWAYNPANPAGEEMELTIRKDSVLSLSCQVFARPGGGHDDSAFARMDLARLSLSRPTVQKTLRDVGLAVTELQDIHDLSGAVDGQLELRAAMDVLFNRVASETPESERIPYIEKVQGQITTTRVEPIDVDTSGA